LNGSDGPAAEKRRSQQGPLPTVSSLFLPLTRLHGLTKKEKENVRCMPVWLCPSERLILPRSVYLNRSEQWSTSSRAVCSLAAPAASSSAIQVKPVTEPINYTKLSKKIIRQSRRFSKLKPV
jgi:hypothetical protein